MFEMLEPRARDLLTATRRFARLQMPRVKTADGGAMSPSEVFLMMRLLRRDPVEGGFQPSELATAMGVTPGNITQLITSLERKGLVARSRDPSDRRAVRVHPTPNGTELVKSAVTAMSRAFSGLADALGEEESAHFTYLLNKASDYIREFRGPGTFGTCDHEPGTPPHTETSR